MACFRCLDVPLTKRPKLQIIEQTTYSPTSAGTVPHNQVDFVKAPQVAESFIG